MVFSKKIEQLYRSKLFTRTDDDGCVFYYSPSDFDGLRVVPYRFKGNRGQILQGYFYSYQDPIKQRLVVFDHGMGGGHRAYMKEIAALARHGYLVFAYDHTGCMESGGDGIGGFAQSLADLDACLCALKAEPQYDEYGIAVVGHSWGAFACLNVASYHSDLTHIIAISGFRSVKAMHRQLFSGIMRIFRKTLYSVEQSTNANYTDADAATALIATNAQVLILHSEDDPVVNASIHFHTLQKDLGNRPNVRFLSVNGKAHNPTYTVDAVKYKDGYFVPLLSKKRKQNALTTDARKKEFLASLDWERMTAQDDTVWQEIFDTLDK